VKRKSTRENKYTIQGITHAHNRGRQGRQVSRN
jgi:hypothetical protein